MDKNTKQFIKWQAAFIAVLFFPLWLSALHDLLPCKWQWTATYECREQPK